MKRMFFLLVVLVAISAPSVAANLVVNGDFSSGETGWTQWTHLRPEAPPENPAPEFFWDATTGVGKASVRYIGNCGWYQMVPTTPGMYYKLTASYMLTGWESWGNVDLFNPTGAEIGADCSGAEFGVHDGRIISGCQWAAGLPIIGEWYGYNPNTHPWVTRSKFFLATGNQMVLSLFAAAWYDIGWGTPWQNINPPYNVQMNFDNVGVEEFATPEPSSLMALAAGLVGLVGLGIRRRR